MRAKRFFYIAAGLFLLAAAYTLGVRRAAADYTPGFGHAIAAWAVSGENWRFTDGNPLFLRDDGMIWYIASTKRWTLAAAGPDWVPPVPLSEILFWSPMQVVTKGGVGWVHANGWENIGAIPRPAGVAVQGNSVSTLKSAYRK